MRKIALAAVLALTGLLAACGGLVEPSTIEDGSGPRAEATAPSEAPSEEASGNPKIGDKAVYPDGVELEITKVKVAKAGPIMILSGGEDDANIEEGDPFYAVTIRVTNGSAKNIELGMLPTVSFGPDGEEASQVLGTGAAGALNGKLVKGKAKSETFGFIVPKKWAKDVQVEITPSFEYDSTVFTGSLAK